MSRDYFRWTDEAVKLVKERYNIDGPKKLAKTLMTTEPTVAMKARRLGLLRKRETQPFVWTSDKIERLKVIYATATKEDLEKEIGFPYYASRYMARKLKLKNIMRAEWAGSTRKNTNKSCDIHYFDKWSSDMAYILGFLFADGSINKRQTDVIVGLAATDTCVLDFIKDRTKSVRPFYTRKSLEFKDECVHQDCVFLTLGSKVMVGKLNELGMYHRKTYRDDPFPNVPDLFVADFIRGYFDGDGSVARRGDGYCTIGFVGSPKLIGGIRNELTRLADMSVKSVHPDNKRGSISVGRLSYTAKEDLKKFYKFIYPEGHGFCLERKKAKLVEWLNKNS